ncbi:MAG: hypothetical protein CMO98_02750 [Woeseia sp.]|nr:hypothetical protein [Woeseia sp.]
MTNPSKNLSEFAVLLIDVQKDFWTKEIATDFPDFPSKVAQLLKFCRTEGLDIIHLRAGFKKDESDWMLRYRLLGEIPCIEETSGTNVLDCAREVQGEPIIIKKSFDGFINPLLEEILEKRNKRCLLVAGLVTSVCVLLTAATAAQKGYLVNVIEDCCADTSEAHCYALNNYPFIFNCTEVSRINTDMEIWISELQRLN